MCIDLLAPSNRLMLLPVGKYNRLAKYKRIRKNADGIKNIVFTVDITNNIPRSIDVT